MHGGDYFSLKKGDFVRGIIKAR